MASPFSCSDHRYALDHDVGLWNFGTVCVIREVSSGALKNCKAVRKAGLRKPGEVLGSLLRLRDFQHQHVFGVEEVLEDPGHLHIISEKGAGQDLSEWLQKLQEEHLWLHEANAAEYLRQALVATAHAHSLGIRHQDLCPSSLVLTSRLPDAKVKVCDFGVEQALDPDMVLLRNGAGPFVAPEVLDGSWGAAVSSASHFAPDVWSLGAIAHALLVGQPPSREDRWVPGASFLGRVGPFGGERWKARSKLSRNFVASLLQHGAGRPTAARALKHPWLQEATGGAIPRWGGTVDAPAEVDHRMLCYLLSILLLPALTKLSDLEHQRCAFAEADSDGDGLIAVRPAAALLGVHGARVAAADAALEVVDVHSSGVFDYISISCAILIAKQFPNSVPGRSGSSTELARKLLRRMVEVYGEPEKLVVDSGKLSRRLHNDAGQYLETHGSVDFEEILGGIPEACKVEAAMFTERLLGCGGRGTPLGGSSAESSRSKAQGVFPWGENLGEIVAAVWETAASSVLVKWSCMGA